MNPLVVTVAGIGAWTPAYTGWPSLRAALRAEAAPGRADGAGAAASGAATSGAAATAAAVPGRPVPQLLPPAERRRVPDGVAVALEVAREALATGGLPAAIAASVALLDAPMWRAPPSAPQPPVATSALSSVFASAHGELAIVDYLCRTLAEDPLALSPTRFHHSVHNAAAGYWTIATPSVGPSTSIAAGDASFALGLFEAATQVVAEARPVLFVSFDTPAAGLLAEAAPNTTLFGTALLLVPAGATDPLRLAIMFGGIDANAAAPPLPAELRALAASSPAARGLALLHALARDDVADDVPVRFEVDDRSGTSAAPARSESSRTVCVTVLAAAAGQPTAARRALA